jgi:hypothetical protein
MKILLQILFFFLLLTQICLGRWFWQNPLRQGNTLNDVCFTNANTGTVMGILLGIHQKLITNLI